MAVSIACAVRMASDPTAFACCYFSAAGTMMSVIDIRAMRLPDSMTLPSYPVMFAALAWASSTTGEVRSLYRAVGAAAVLLAIFSILHLTAGVGLGDVKLVGLIGMLLGFHGWIVAFRGLFLACIIAAGWAATVRLRGRRGSYIPMGPALVAGTLLAIAA